MRQRAAPWSTLWGRETFCSRVGVKAAGSGAPEARIHNHARYMHGKDRNMRQCDMVLAAGAHNTSIREGVRYWPMLHAFCCSFIYWWTVHVVTHPSLGSAGFRRGAQININAVPANRNPFQDFYWCHLSVGNTGAGLPSLITPPEVANTGPGF